MPIQFELSNPSIVQTREEFCDAVRDLTEERVVKFVKSHRLAFLEPEEGIKIRKKEKRHPVEGNQSGRSNRLKTSLVVLSDGTIFRTGRNQLAQKSIPGRRAAIFLGAGSEKSVYKVKNLNTGEAVAIGVAYNSSESLRNECRISQINSPYIHRSLFYSVRKDEAANCQSSSKGYAVSKVCQGSLDHMIGGDRDYLEKHPEHLTHVEKALEACRAAGVIHNDLQGNNIFITEDGTAVLSDFGEALRIEELTEEMRNKMENKQLIALNDLRSRYAVAINPKSLQSETRQPVAWNVLGLGGIAIGSLLFAIRLMDLL